MRIKYKMRYYFGKILVFFGICRYCYSPTMRLPSGGIVCTNCRKRF